MLTRKETDRPGLKFYQVGKRINLEKIFKHSTQQSIEEFKSKKIDLETLRNRASTKQIRDNMSKEEKSAYDKKIYANLTKSQLEEKRLRQREYYKRLNERGKDL